MFAKPTTTATVTSECQVPPYHQKHPKRAAETGRSAQEDRVSTYQPLGHRRPAKPRDLRLAPQPQMQPQKSVHRLDCQHTAHAHSAHAVKQGSSHAPPSESAPQPAPHAARDRADRLTSGMLASINRTLVCLGTAAVAVAAGMRWSGGQWQKSSGLPAARAARAVCPVHRVQSVSISRSTAASMAACVRSMV